MNEDKFKRPVDPAAKLRELREGRKEAAQELLEAVEETGSDSFSTLSADRQQKVMLELRFKTGDAEAFPYSYLCRARLNPSQGIMLDFTVAEVLIAGRNLRPLFAGLVAQRVATVMEQDDLQAEATGSKEAAVVTKIEVKKHTRD